MSHTPTHSRTPWQVRTNPRDEDYCFIQAPRNKPSDPYDIEVMGEDMHEELYLPKQKRADAQRIVACVNACAPFEDPANEIAAKDTEVAQLKARVAELEQGVKDAIAEMENKGKEHNLKVEYGLQNNANKSTIQWYVGLYGGLNDAIEILTDKIKPQP